MGTLVQGNGALQDRLLQLFLAAGSGWVLVALLALSVASLAVAFGRLAHFWRHRGGGARLAEGVATALARGDLPAAQAQLEADPSHAAAVALRAAAAVPQGPDAVTATLAAASVGARLTMEHGLAFLGTLGNNAPFLGLFGTVLGIMRAFGDLAASPVGGGAAVMAGIAESLVATAVGLAVALPAVAMFNLLQRRIRVELARIDALGYLLVGYASAERR